MLSRPPAAPSRPPTIRLPAGTAPRRGRRRARTKPGRSPRTARRGASRGPARARAGRAAVRRATPAPAPRPCPRAARARRRPPGLRRRHRSARTDGAGATSARQSKSGSPARPGIDETDSALARRVGRLVHQGRDQRGLARERRQCGAERWLGAARQRAFQPQRELVRLAFGWERHRSPRAARRGERTAPGRGRATATTAPARRSASRRGTGRSAPPGVPPP